MFPSEMVILMAIAVNKDSGKKPLTRPRDVLGEYIGYLYNSLVNSGYLKRGWAGGYQLTPTGNKAVLAFLNRNETKAKDVIKRLERLGIEHTREMDKLVRKAIGVK